MKPPILTDQPSEEFVLRVNDFIQMANRIERRHDSAHAQMAFVHAFSRYSAHHYFNTVKNDGPEEREAYASHIAGAVLDLVRGNFEQLRGQSSVAGDPAPE